MSAVLEVPKKTYDDYALLPEGTLAQLIDGEFVMSPAPIPKHQKIVGKIYSKLENYVTNKNLGEVFISPVDVYFDNEETYQPDIIFIGKDRLNIIGEKKIEAAPDLIIEVLSENNAYYDLRHKKKIYEKYAVKEYWIVDPIEKSVEIFQSQAGNFVLVAEKEKQGSVASKLLSGFSADLEFIFS